MSTSTQAMTMKLKIGRNKLVKYHCTTYRPEPVSRKSRNEFVKIIVLLNLSESIPNVKFNQPTFTCLKLTIKTLEQGVKYVQS